MEPQLSIGITAYNEGKMLNACWESVVAQRDSRWKAVMVLDGGGDTHTEKIFTNISHPRLTKIVCAENVGAYPARTRAIEAAECEWYVHLDADDRLPKDAVRLIMEAIKREPDAEFVYGDVRLMRSSGIAVNRITHFAEKGLVYSPVVHGQAPIRVDLFHRVGGFTPDLYEYGVSDWDFWISVAESGAIGVRAEGVIYERSYRLQSTGDRSFFRRDEVVEILIERHPGYFGDHERQRMARGKAYELNARDYRRIGHRNEAAKYAHKAIDLGVDSPTMREILHEAQMSIWRFAIRRLARKLTGSAWIDELLRMVT